MSTSGFTPSCSKTRERLPRSKSQKTVKPSARASYPCARTGGRDVSRLRDDEGISWRGGLGTDPGNTRRRRSDKVGARVRRNFLATAHRGRPDRPRPSLTRAATPVWRQGHAVQDTLRPDRLIAGVTTAEGEKAIRAVYAPILDAGVPIFVTDPQTAELAKGAANTFLGLKISYINAVADMCQAAGGDVSQIVEILGIDPRIGSGGMMPGIGYGGGCLPKDVRASTASARQLGATRAADLLRAAEKINEDRTAVAMNLIRDALGDRPVTGAKITVWGAAFKPGTNDVRESPALALAHALQQAGATVTVHDPQAVATAMTRNPELDYTDDLAESVDGADLVVLATEWPDYQQADPQALLNRPANPLLVDCRTTLDPEPWCTAGWTIHQLGRPGK
ncbi:nucleotide sugar dehydrogenase [Streptomyces sp. NPDC008265]|uniref:nucleotide sugar dehydrogenase n=1 Tax=Streptomyces sp. NPDC008265 TaxID=3364824 RepID=UPI0036E3EC1B